LFREVRTFEAFKGLHLGIISELPRKSLPQIAVEILQELKAYGFTIELVLADSLYRESGDATGEISKHQLPYIVAIRSNHPVLMPKGWKVRYNRWHSYQQALLVSEERDCPKLTGRSALQKSCSIRPILVPG
jgi:SRSO17 transposase